MARIGVHKEVQKLVREIAKHGYGVRFDGNEHLSVLKPDGEQLRWPNGAPVTLPNSPGSQQLIANMRVKLVKAGIPLDEKKTQTKARGEKEVRLDALRERIVAFLGNEVRGDRATFVRLAFEVAEEKGIAIPYGLARKKQDGPGVTAIVSAEKSLSNFLNERFGFNSTTERFWTQIVEVLEDTKPAPVEERDFEITVTPVGKELDDALVGVQPFAADAKEIPSLEEIEALTVDRAELLMRIITLAAMADPQHYAQVVHQSRELVNFVLAA